MTDADSWPILQLLIALAALTLGMLYTGILVENSSQKDLAQSGVGMSLKTISALLLCTPFLIWAAACIARMVRATAALTVPDGTQPGFSYYLITVAGYFIAAVAVTMLCVLLPFSWGRAHSNSYEKSFAFMKPLVALFLPLAKLVILPARRILGARGVASEIGTVSEEDLLELVDSVEAGDIDATQKEMIGNIFDLGDLTAEDIMTHRTEMEALPLSATTDDIINIAVEFGYSRLPVYDGTLDNIVGIAYVKDLLPYVGKGTRSIDLKKLLRPTIFVPESRRARELLFDFKQKKIQLAVVVDEYGGTAGIVTMEDILESIVGDIEDEYDEEESYIVRNADGSLTCDGYAEVDDVFGELGLGDAPEEIESDTIGGLLTQLLARIPKKGEQPTATYDGIELRALDADERRITCVLVRKTAPLSGGEKEE